LWLLIFRGLALELRSHVDHVLWRQGWDAAFTTASLLLAVVFGAALGNLIRGVPLNSDGYFFVPFWTDFLTGPEPGILDWFTVLTGATSASILAFHGANYLAMKTEDGLHRRTASIASVMGWVSAGCTVLTMIAVPLVQPSLRLNFVGHPMGYLVPLSGIFALGSSLYFRHAQRDTAAFLTSSLFILTMLASVAVGMYPYLLASTTDPALSLTVFNAATDSYGLTAGFAWFGVGFALILAHQVYVHYLFRGKARDDAH
jgi:cytochrome d ubiquinol oxidase subunit II